MWSQATATYATDRFLSMLELFAATEEHVRDIGIDPYAVGAIALVILHAALLALLAFGKGREHT